MHRSKNKRLISLCIIEKNKRVVKRYQTNVSIYIYIYVISVSHCFLYVFENSLVYLELP